MADITLKVQLLKAYANGQRHFEDVDLDFKEDLSDVVLSGAVFKGCWLNVNFIRADLSNCQFLECSLKTADFRYANLTNALMKWCTVESTRFQYSIVDGFVFDANSAYGQECGQEDFDAWVHST